MNKVNVRKAIRIMSRVKDHELYMAYFQGDFGGVKTEKELHKCGNTACFAGWVAVSKEFQKDGGRCSDGGCPILGTDSAEWAIAKWLDIDPHLAYALVYGYGYRIVRGTCEDTYPVPFKDVKPQHVIAVLERILSGKLK